MLGGRLLILPLAVVALVFAAFAVSAAAQDAVDRYLANADVAYPDALDRYLANQPAGPDALARYLGNQPAGPDALARYLANQPEAVPELPSATPAPEAFSWADAGIGAAIAIGGVIVLLLAGLAVLSYRRHEAPWHWGHGHPSV